VAALLHHRHARAHLDRLVDVMRDEQHGRAERAVQSQEFVLQALAHDRVDGAEWLVHEHDWRLGGHGARDAYALAFAA